jgi:hypothetical protein
MKDYKDVLQRLEESTKTIQDPELRKIAFQELLKHALEGEEKAKPETMKADKAQRVPKPRKKTSVGTRTGTVPAVRDEITNIDISPDEPELPPWGSLSLDWKKFCWVLEAARRKGVDGLTNSEISFLTEKVFRESYDRRVVNNLKLKIKSG